MFLITAGQSRVPRASASHDARPARKEILPANTHRPLPAVKKGAGPLVRSKLDGHPENDFLRVHPNLIVLGIRFPLLETCGNPVSRK